MNRSTAGIQVGHSALFRSIDGLRNRLTHTSDPVELVFPAREEEYSPLLRMTDEIIATVTELKATVLSIHSPPVRMADDDFSEVAAVLAGLAASIGATSITLHPSKCMNSHERVNLQLSALKNLRLARDQTTVTLAVETLAHRKCLFTEDEIIDFSLPMVLDTTHLGWAVSYDVFERYSDSIVTIHLSERTEHSQHQRIGDGSMSFVDHIVSTGWKGSIILEYWPWRWKCYAEDTAKVREGVATASQREN